MSEEAGIWESGGEASIKVVIKAYVISRLGLQRQGCQAYSPGFWQDMGPRSRPWRREHLRGRTPHSMPACCLQSRSRGPSVTRSWKPHRRFPSSPSSWEDDAGCGHWAAGVTGGLAPSLLPGSSLCREVMEPGLPASCAGPQVPGGQTPSSWHRCFTERALLLPEEEGRALGRWRLLLGQAPKGTICLGGCTSREGSCAPVVLGFHLTSWVAKFSIRLWAAASEGEQWSHGTRVPRPHPPGGV